MKFINKHVSIIVGCLVTIVLSGCSYFPMREAGEREEFQRLRTISFQEFAGETRKQPAADELTKNPTLSDYLAYAALHNPDLKAAFNRWKAALEKIPQVSSLPDPRFTYAYFIRKVETRVGPQRQKFALSQTFPWFGKLALRGDAAFQAANAEREKYEAKKLRLFYEVKNTYYEYYYLARAIDLTKENIKLLQYIEEIARTRYATGIGSFSNITKTQMELGKLRDRLEALKDLRDPVVSKLNAALNRPPKAQLPWPHEAPTDSLTLSEDKLTQWLKKQNPELKLKNFLASKEKIRIALAKKNYFPDITLGVQWIETDKALKSNTKDSGKDPVIAMFSLNLPIWRGKYEAARREAEAKLLAVQRERKQKENSLIADLRMALYKYRDAERKIHLYKDVLLPKADQTLRSNLQAFETGTGSFLDLLDTQRTLLEFQLLYERAIADRAQGLSRIEAIVGKDLNAEAAENVKSTENTEDRT